MGEGNRPSIDVEAAKRAFVAAMQAQLAPFGLRACEVCEDVVKRDVPCERCGWLKDA